MKANSVGLWSRNTTSSKFEFLGLYNEKKESKQKQNQRSHVAAYRDGNPIRDWTNQPLARRVEINFYSHKNLKKTKQNKLFDVCRQSKDDQITATKILIQSEKLKKKFSKK